jgi:hypothetical protein
VLTGSVSRGVADDLSDIEMLVVSAEQPRSRRASTSPAPRGWPSLIPGVPRMGRRGACPGSGTAFRSS